MPIYSLPGNYNPTLFDSKLCNCYRFFNDAFASLEDWLGTYIKTRKFDDGGGQRAGEIRRGFNAAYIILGEGDSDLSLAEFRWIFMQYAFIGSLLEDVTFANRFFDQRWADVRSLSGGDIEFYIKLSRAAVRRGEPVVISEREIPVIGNLAMFLAVSRGIAVCESRDYLQLSANDFLLRFILAVAHDGSPLVRGLGNFSWLNLPEELIMNRTALFMPALAASKDELDVGKRYVLKIILNNFKDYSLDDESAACFRLGYDCYNQLYEETTRVLDAKAREFELYHLYGGSTEHLPDSWHFKHLTDSREAVTNPGAFIAAAFNKNAFSSREVELIRDAAVKNPGMLDCLLDQIYYFNPMKGFTGHKKIKFTFLNYPRVINTDFAQYAETAVNYFWLPEMPQKVVNAADDSDFYMVDHIRKYRNGQAPLKYKLDAAEASALEEPFKGLYMYGYGSRLLELSFNNDFFTDNPAFVAFIHYLRNLPKEMASRVALHLLKYGGNMPENYTEIALNQLIFVSPNPETLKKVVTLSPRAGRHVKALLDVLGLTPDQLTALLGERDLGKLASSLIDWKRGGIFYQSSVAAALERRLSQGAALNDDEALYLSTSYALYSFESSVTFEALTKAAGLLLKDGGGGTTDMMIRFISLYLNEKLDRLQIDADFAGSFKRLWELSAERATHRDEVCAILWRLLAAGDSPVYGELTTYFEKLADAGQYDSCVVREFLVFRRLKTGQTISADEADRMRKLYMTQGVVTARTETVVNTLFGDDPDLYQELFAFEWIEGDRTWSHVTAVPVEYGDYIEGETVKAAAYASEPLEPEKFTFLLNIGFVNVFKMSYEVDGKTVIRMIRRGFSGNPGRWRLILSRAREFISGTSDNPGFLLLAGRICVDESVFQEDILLEYIKHLADTDGSAGGVENRRKELARAVVFAASSHNAMTKACIYAKDSEAMALRLKMFFETCFSVWGDIKGKIDIGELFAYVRSLERIAGAERLGGISAYLADYILYTPGVRADLSEEFKARTQAGSL